MKNKSYFGQGEVWISVAANEFQLLRERLLSDNCKDVARELAFSRDTLRKLKVSAPDKTLRFTTLLMIYAILLYIIRYKSEVKDYKSDREFILESLGRVISSCCKISDKVTLNLIEDGYMTPDGDRTDRVG